MHGSLRTQTYDQLLDDAYSRELRGISLQILSLPGQSGGLSAVVHARVRFPFGEFEGVGEAHPEDIRHTESVLLIAMNRAKRAALEDALRAPHQPQSHEAPSVHRNGGQNHSQGYQSTSYADSENGQTPNLNSFGITSAQQRFLFRLLAERGVAPARTKQKLCEIGGVQYVNQLSKKQASELIQAIQNGEIQCNGAHVGG